MKKYICTALALLTAVSLFVGCGCSNQNVSDQPGGKITAPTAPATTNPMPTMTTPPEESTRPSTMPATEGTMPSTGETDGIGGMDGTDGTGIMPDASQPMPGTTEAGTTGRSAGRNPRGRMG